MRRREKQYEACNVVPFDRAAVHGPVRSVPGSQAKDDRAEVALQAAIKKEMVDGDLKGAIEQYKKIAQSGNRAAAARALVRMGQCQERLGEAEARKAYEKVVREYADQAEAAAEARTRLVALGSAGRDSRLARVAGKVRRSSSERLNLPDRAGRTSRDSPRTARKCFTWTEGQRSPRQPLG